MLRAAVDGCIFGATRDLIEHHSALVVDGPRANVPRKVNGRQHDVALILGVLCRRAILQARRQHDLALALCGGLRGADGVLATGIVKLRASQQVLVRHREGHLRSLVIEVVRVRGAAGALGRRVMINSNRDGRGLQVNDEAHGLGIGLIVRCVPRLIG